MLLCTSFNQAQRSELVTYVPHKYVHSFSLRCHSIPHSQTRRVDVAMAWNAIVSSTSASGGETVSCRLLRWVIIISHNAQLFITTIYAIMLARANESWPCFGVQHNFIQAHIRTLRLPACRASSLYSSAYTLPRLPLNWFQTEIDFIFVLFLSFFVWS